MQLHGRAEVEVGAALAELSGDDAKAHQIPEDVTTHAEANERFESGEQDEDADEHPARHFHAEPDGTTTAGTVDEDLGTVSGTHAYLDLGNHTVTVTISDSDGDSVATVVTIFIFNPPSVPGMTAWGMAIATALLAVAYGWARRRRTAGVA